MPWSGGKAERFVAMVRVSYIENTNRKGGNYLVVESGKCCDSA